MSRGLGDVYKRQVHGCRDSALLALVSNPLVGNVTDARALLDEVLTINRPWLTQFN